MTKKTYYTRAEYMKDSQTDGMSAHRRYYGQFVNASTKYRVLSNIGLDRLKASTDPHFNDIPLELWDKLTPRLAGSSEFSKAGDFYTLGNGVCLAKEAARQILEQQTKEQQP